MLVGGQFWFDPRCAKILSPNGLMIRRMLSPSGIDRRSAGVPCTGHDARHLLSLMSRSRSNIGAAMRQPRASASNTAAPKARARPSVAWMTSKEISEVTATSGHAVRRRQREAGDEGTRRPRLGRPRTRRRRATRSPYRFDRWLTDSAGALPPARADARSPVATPPIGAPATPAACSSGWGSPRDPPSRCESALDACSRAGSGHPRRAWRRPARWPL